MPPAICSGVTEPYRSCRLCRLPGQGAGDENFMVHMRSKWVGYRFGSVAVTFFFRIFNGFFHQPVPESPTSGLSRASGKPTAFAALEGFFKKPGQSSTFQAPDHLWPQRDPFPDGRMISRFVSSKIEPL